jgi:hypothetical protein
VRVKSKQPAERFAPKAVTGASFDAIMRAALAVPPLKPKKGSRPKSAKKKP